MDQLTTWGLGLVLFGGVYDLFTARIPNWFNFPAMLAGVALQLFLGGWTSAGWACAGLATGFVLFFPLYVAGIMGAGDVKLLMVVGAWTAPLYCLRAAVAAILIGAVYAVINLLFAGRLKRFGVSAYRFLRSLIVPGYPMQQPDLDKERKFRFGVCLALAMMVITVLEHKGLLS